MADVKRCLTDAGLATRQLTWPAPRPPSRPAPAPPRPRPSCWGAPFGAGAPPRPHQLSPEDGGVGGRGGRMPTCLAAVLSPAGVGGRGGDCLFCLSPPSSLAALLSPPSSLAAGAGGGRSLLGQEERGSRVPVLPDLPASLLPPPAPAPLLPPSPPTVVSLEAGDRTGAQEVPGDVKRC